MAPNLEEEMSMPLSQFVNLPTTVAFQSLYTPRFRRIISRLPFVRLGNEIYNSYIVGYINEQYVGEILNALGRDFLFILPRLLSPTDAQSNDVTGITRVLNQPFLNLSGRGVIIGIVDTGIDYRKDAFKFEDGSTKILNIWDQTIDGERDGNLYFGSTYNSDKINQALRSEDPYTIVPTMDEDGHGTFLASVAASNEKGDYMGAAPKANLIVVKLRRAGQFLIKRYLVSEDNPSIFESSDFVLGIDYIVKKSEEYDMPMVMCIGLGSNGGAHDGSGMMEQYISFVAQRVGFAFMTAVGNEGNTKHHTQGKISATKSTDRINIKVGNQGTSFTVLIFGPGYDKISIGIRSPAGEAVSRVSFRSGLEYTNRLFLEETTITIRYYRDNNTNIIVGFERATQGIWEIILYGDLIISGEYWAWLPITGQVSPSVEFLKPVPEYTAVLPSTGLRAIKIGAYNSNDQSLLVSSSWGPTRLPRPAPDFVAPGVDVNGIYPTGYGTMTGTSVAAAVATGAAALLMEWGIVKGNNAAMDSDLIRSYLISGCERDENLTYPDVKWGFGKLDLFQTFELIKETSPVFEDET